MAGSAYYTLIASLPRLLPFERADRVPINRVRLDQRLTMLNGTDSAQLAAAEILLEWQYQSLTLNDVQVAMDYQDRVQRFGNTALRDFIQFRLELRAVVAALRARRLGVSQPKHWWPRARWLADHWDDPLFQLGGTFPWLAQARTDLDSGDALALERLLMNEVWRYCSCLSDEYPFGFEAVFAYVFQWDIVNRWLSYDERAARSRFQQMSKEVLGEQAE